MLCVVCEGKRIRFKIGRLTRVSCIFLVIVLSVCTATYIMAQYVVANLHHNRDLFSQQSLLYLASFVNTILSAHSGLHDQHLFRYSRGQ